MIEREKRMEEVEKIEEEVQRMKSERPDLYSFWGKVIEAGIDEETLRRAFAKIK